MYFGEAEDDYDYKVSQVAIAAWASPNIMSHADPWMSNEDLIDMLMDHLVFNPPVKDLRRLKPPRDQKDKFTIAPYQKFEQAVRTPDLLTATCAVFHNATKKILSNKSLTREEAVAALVDELRGYDFVIPRSPLKHIMITAISDEDVQEWVLFASKPLDGGPVFIDRFIGYDKNFGAASVLFKDEMTTEPPTLKHGTYAVCKGVMPAGERVLFSGEIDCVNISGGIVDLRVKPIWSKFNYSRQFSNWLHSAMTGTAVVLTGLLGTEESEQRDEEAREALAAVDRSDLSAAAISLLGGRSSGSEGSFGAGESKQQDCGYYGISTGSRGSGVEGNSSGSGSSGVGGGGGVSVGVSGETVTALAPTATYRVARDRNCPIIFRSDRLEPQSLSEYGSTIPLEEKNRVFDYGSLMLQAIANEVVVVGVVYRIICDIEGNITCMKCDASDPPFLVNRDLLVRCADACLTLAEIAAEEEEEEGKR